MIASPREQLRALVLTVEWSVVLRAISAALRKAPAHRREDMKSEVLLALVERAEQSEQVKSWAGLAVVIAKRIALKARDRNRLELHDLGSLPARSRVSYDEVVRGERSATLKRIRGFVQAAIIDGISAGESCELTAARIARPLDQIRRVAQRLQKKIENLAKTERESTGGGTL